MKWEKCGAILNWSHALSRYSWQDMCNTCIFLIKPLKYQGYATEQRKIYGKYLSEIKNTTCTFNRWCTVVDWIDAITMAEKYAILAILKISTSIGTGWL